MVPNVNTLNHAHGYKLATLWVPLPQTQNKSNKVFSETMVSHVSGLGSLSHVLSCLLQQCIQVDLELVDLDQQHAYTYMLNSVLALCHH